MNCNACGGKLGNLLYFCTTCWNLIPGKERVALYTMHNKGQPTDTKVAKCVRILKERRAKETFVAK